MAKNTDDFKMGGLAFLQRPDTEPDIELDDHRDDHEDQGDHRDQVAAEVL